MWTLEGGFQPVGGTPGPVVPPAARRRAQRREWAKWRVARSQRAVRRAVKRLHWERRVAAVILAAELLVMAAGSFGERAVVPVALVMAVPTGLAWASLELSARSARREQRDAQRAARLLEASHR